MIKFPNTARSPPTAPFTMMLPTPAANVRSEDVPAILPSKVMPAPAPGAPPLVVSNVALPVKTVGPFKVTAPPAVVMVNAPMEIWVGAVKIRLPPPVDVISAPIIISPPPAPSEAVIVRDTPVVKLLSVPAPLMVINPVPVPPVPAAPVVTVTLVVASCVLISAHCKLEILAVLSVVKAPAVLVTSVVAALLISKSDGSKSNIPICPFAARVLTVPR